MSSLFVSATDTDVGKTYVSSLLVNQLKPRVALRYWKPLGSGVPSDSDKIRITCGPACVIESVYEMAESLSPHLAAAHEGKKIECDLVIRKWRELANQSVVVEGAGGLLVPLSETALQIDLIKSLELPILLVTHDKVGAINHTLLCLEACRARKITVAAVVLNRYRGDLGNGESIQHFGKTRVISIYENGLFDSVTLDFLAEGFFL